MEKPFKKALIFGTFDILHEGHYFVIKEALKEAKSVLVALPSDETVLRLKSQKPLNSFESRTQNLKTLFPTLEIKEADKDTGSWNIISSENPDTIILGYDQEALEANLNAFLKQNNIEIKIIKLKPWKDGLVHSSTLRQN